MYLSADAVIAAIQLLREEVHPFVGITLLACKKYDLPVGRAEQISLDSLTRDHLDHYHVLDRASSYYFQPFRSSQEWVTNKYPSGGLQTINTQTFGDIFIHPRNSRTWGLAKDYLSLLRSRLREIGHNDRFSAGALAVWLYKSEDIGSINRYDDLVSKFFLDFHFTENEIQELFTTELKFPFDTIIAPFISEPLAISEVAKEFAAPPDADAEGGKTIASLHLVNAGPAADLRIEFGERLSLITGDNGLGKSFILDFAWWAATGNWAGRPAMPLLGTSSKPALVEYSLLGKSGKISSFESHFERTTMSWTRQHAAMTIEALAVFSRADGAFSLSDPLQARFHKREIEASLSPQEVWDGRPGIIEGLIRDWPRWEAAKDKTAFDRFASVLKRLSPEDLGVLIPSGTVRLPGDPRDIPTVQHRYGTVPVVHASAGVQRILLLAYLIIWLWEEHQLAANQLQTEPLRRMLVIVDELEAHLHPKWQRIVLPALMGAGELLSSDLTMQVISATHSPLILASIETTFDEVQDGLFHLFGEGGGITLEEVPFVKYGDASGWLTSPLFGLRHARSKEAERAIEDAKKLQLQDVPDANAISEVFSRLKRYLAEDDKFWPRWLYFAERHGVDL